MLNIICSNIEVRQVKNFNEAEFLRDLRMIDWNRVTTHNNPNEMWDFWKHLLASVIDKHAPFRTKRVKNKRSPWITNELLREIHKRDFLKKKAASTNDPLIWKQLKEIRPIPQRRKLNVNTFLKTLMQTKVILVKPSDELMNPNLGKVNQPKCLKSKQ